MKKYIPDGINYDKLAEIVQHKRTIHNLESNRYNQRKRDLGFVLAHYWVKPEVREMIKDLIHKKVI